jgi:tRNA G18 (ribose-2'-O)-methylase SpoU
MRIDIDQLDDVRLAAYRNLKDRALHRQGDRFIAEGRLLVERLLASRVPVDSVLAAQRVADDIARLTPQSVPLYVVPDALLHGIVGFKFHTGTLACGRRPANPSLDELARDQPGRRTVVVVCPRLIEHDNLGSIIRTATALGAAGLITGPQCCDPYWRKCVRVSMGMVFGLPIRRSDDLAADLEGLRLRGFQRIATVLRPGAQPLRTLDAGPRCAVLMGAEDQGLDDADLAHCDRLVTIPMHGNADSLNVAVTAALVLHQLL